MRQLLERAIDLSLDTAFLQFQNTLARNVYEALGQGYASNENEVALIKRLVGAIDSQSFGRLRTYATIIYGPRSYVEFNYMDKPVTKELGDMVVITLVTDGADRLLQKISIIQNKKEQDQHWRIDLEQLYLLKNFPSFAGNKGIFRNCTDVTFRNLTGCLGTYGLFQAPGEMILASAPLITELLRGKQELVASDLSLLPNISFSRWNSGSSLFPWWPLVLGRHPQEFLFMVEEIFHHDYPMGGGYTASGFLGNIHFSRDIYDFVRDWTQLNIGEPSFVMGRVLNPATDAFANFVIRSAGFERLRANLPPDRIFGDQKFEGRLAVLLMHLDVSEEE